MRMLRSIVRARALSHVEPGMAACIVGPLRWDETEHAAENDQCNRRLEDDRGNCLRSELPKAPGGALQGFIAGLENGKLHEPVSLGHDKKFGFETTEHGIDVDIEI